MDYKIFKLIDSLTDSYSESVQLVDGLQHNLRRTLNTIEFYSNDQYLSGNLDEIGREKPFYNICNYRVTVAKVATDLDVKDIRFEADLLKHSVQAMLYNKELYQFLKEINFSKTLNEMGLTRPKYGGVLVKKGTDSGELKIDVVDWKNVYVDPATITNGAIIETHYLEASELKAKDDVWKNVDEVIEAHAKLTKNKPEKIEIKEITGEFTEDYEPDKENVDPKKFIRLCFYVACVGKKKFYLYHEPDKGDKYKYLPWQRVPGRGLGRGVVEDGFEAQVWTNDVMIAAKNATALTTKVGIVTDSQKISGNAITGYDSGHIFQLEAGRSMLPLNLGPSKLPEIQNLVELWKQQYDATSSTYDANTGEAPTSGTPYSQTALLNQVANSPFEYRREEWGIFLNEILNDWILPHLKKRIMKEHNLVADYDDEELQVIDEAISTFEANNETKKRLLSGKMVSAEDYQAMRAEVEQALGQTGTKREIEIPEKFLDVKGKLSANITGELKNKQAILQSLDSIFKTVVSTLNPQTGEYAALTDPGLSKIFGTIMEMAGTPLSFAQLKTKGQATPPADLSAVSPVSPQNGARTATTV